ncbi:MAG TPA: serine/threonine-protein kinase, partial [Thermoanaerobaculia bacterium]|nr:serine/threonine-protein kinase [Thermoanaerobaculia bacterium]
MSIAPGTRMGSYEIGDLLGAGGMGTVYRAHDTRLKRNVAIKVLSDAVTHDPERLARFEREARLLAAINHPHIAGIHGIDEAGGQQFLVMELVEGETLWDRLASGALPLGESLEVARQISEALEAAHEKGIVHRDLKPSNVQVGRDGRVKLLDFGLAKALEPDLSGSGVDSLSRSPTISHQMTGVGVILGTAAYMSPEQVRGRSVDRRADIWALGVVLYEMLTGRRLFAGETVSDTLASVLKTDPDWSLLPAETPAIVRRLLARCLERDPKQRLHDAGDARLEIEEALGELRGLSSSNVTGVVAPLAREFGPVSARTAIAAAVAL